MVLHGGRGTSTLHCSTVGQLAATKTAQRRIDYFETNCVFDGFANDWGANVVHISLECRERNGFEKGGIYCGF